MTIREQAAQSLDRTLDAASRKVGIHTDAVRAQVAAYLDGALKLKASAVRRRIRYLKMVAR